MSHVQPPTGAVAFRNLVRSLSIHLRWTPLCRGCRWTMMHCKIFASTHFMLLLQSSRCPVSMLSSHAARHSHSNHILHNRSPFLQAGDHLESYDLDFSIRHSVGEHNMHLLPRHRVQDCFRRCYRAALLSPPRIQRPGGTGLANHISIAVDEASSIAGSSPVDVTHTACPVVWAYHSAALMRFPVNLQRGVDRIVAATRHLRRSLRFAACCRRNWY
jgi:hypothetical protein